jgi:hypothetical protein
MSEISRNDSQDASELTEQERIAQEVRQAREEFSRPFPQEYKNSRGSSLLEFPEISFSAHLEEDLPGFEKYNILEKYFKGRDVIDCGSGGTSRFVAGIAKKAEAKSYTAIDIGNMPFHLIDERNVDESLRQHKEAFKLWQESHGKNYSEGIWKTVFDNPFAKSGDAPTFVAAGKSEETGLPIVMLKEDMLVALSKMKAEGDKFFVIAGVDAGYEEFWDAFASEIDRLASNGDAAYICGINGLPKRLEAKGWAHIPLLVHSIWVKGKSQLNNDDVREEMQNWLKELEVEEATEK